MEKKVDLHVHTNLSDGTFPPSQVVQTALEKGLSAIAICDHDTTAGIEPSMEAAKGTGLEIIPGVEMTCEIEGHEVHLLGYFIDHRQAWLNNVLEGMRDSRVERTYRMIDKLNKFGFDIKADEIFKLAGDGTVGRIHVAMALKNKGYIKSIQEAFDKYIGEDGPCNTTRTRMTADDAIAAVKKAGGVPVVAHPWSLGDDKYIAVLAQHGLRGVEAYHPDHTPPAAHHYERIANDLGLIVTGGSDCHGMLKGFVMMGTIELHYDIVDKLRGESEDIKRKNAK